MKIRIISLVLAAILNQVQNDDNHKNVILTNPPAGGQNRYFFGY
jgi:hypothetical protein